MKYLFTVAFSLFSVVSFAAADSTVKEKATLTLAGIYGSNANYYGQTTDQRLPYVLTNASYQLAGGFYISASAYKLLNLGGSGVSEVDVSAGYNWSFSRAFSGGIGYTRSFFPEDSPLLQASNKNMVSGSLDYDWNILTSGIEADYAFGSESDLFLTFSGSRLIDLGSLLGDKGFFTVEPELEVVGGTQHYLEEYTIRKNNREKLIDLIKNPFTPPGLEKQTETKTVARSSFDLLSYNLNVPVGYNRSSYLIEASYQMSLLGRKVAANWQKPRSFFNLSFYYQF